MDEKAKLVYSSGPDGSGRAPGGAPSAERASLPPERQSIRVRRETAGRGGKAVTTMRTFQLARADAEALLKRLKALCGAGGTIRQAEDGLVLEVQGDHVDKLVAELRARGFKANRG
ncbi:MAG: translation initiation factor [Candidatus Polarisedimenticolia bacterium]|nr:translation initiation factor [bacterium]